MAKTSELVSLRKYVAEIDRFAGLLRKTQENIGELERDLAVKKLAYDGARQDVREAKEVEHATVSLLLRFVTPGSPDVLPLFDTLEPADEEKQGAGAGEWRKEPIAVLGLSAAAMRALIAADIVLVGQLQDRMLADPDDWHAEIEGLSAGIGEAVAAKFHAYVEEKSG